MHNEPDAEVANAPKEVLNAEDREWILSYLNRDEVDPEFLPYLDRINSLPCVVVMGCCAGHVEYREGIDEPPEENSGRWGYLQLAVTPNLMETITYRALDSWHWLWWRGSQLPTPYNVREDAFRRPPDVTPFETYAIAFAWDASEWPKPAEDICKFLEAYASIS